MSSYTPIVSQSLKIKSIPMGDSPPQVIYSLPLKNAKANEQLQVQVIVDADVSKSNRGRLSTEVFLADAPKLSRPERVMWRQFPAARAS